MRCYRKIWTNFLDNPICHYCNNWYHCDIHTAAAAKSRQSCPTLCNPIDVSPPGSSIPGILQARILEASTLNRKTVEFYFPLKLGSRKFQAIDHIKLRQKPCQDSVWALLDSCKSAHLPDVPFPLDWLENTTSGKKSEGGSHSVVYNSLWPHGLQPARPPCPENSPGKNATVGCHFLLQGIFPTQKLNPGLLRCRQILYHLSHQGGPKDATTCLIKLMGGKDVMAWDATVKVWSLVQCTAGKGRLLYSDFSV